MGVYFSEGEVKSGMVRSLHRWWLSRCSDDVPERSQFEPCDFKALLPNILIADIEHSPFRVRYRLIGTKVVEATGFEITGRYLDELMPTKPEAPWMDLYEQTVRLRKPTLGTSTCTTTWGGTFTHEFGMFPLRRGGLSVDQVLSIEDYADLSSRLSDLVNWRLKPVTPQSDLACSPIEQMLRPAGLSGHDPEPHSRDWPREGANRAIPLQRHRPLSPISRPG